jgi:hypothetical protein
MTDVPQGEGGPIVRPALHKVTLNAVEIAVTVLLLGLGALVFNEALRLGAGWSYAGPRPGFFPMIMTVLMIGGALGTLLVCILKPDRRPCFEASHELVNLALVGGPILLVILAMPWLGLYVVSGIYLAAFMIFYGKFRWWVGLLGGLILAVSLWVFLVKVLNISMPTSVFYRSGALPF